MRDYRIGTAAENGILLRSEMPALMPFSHPPGTLEPCTLPFAWWQSTWTAPCCRPFRRPSAARNAQALRAAQEAGITVAIATGRRTAYTAPLLEGLGLRADTPLITSNGAVTRTLGGDALDRSTLESRVARGLCGLLRPFGAVVFTFDRPGARRAGAGRPGAGARAHRAVGRGQPQRHRGGEAAGARRWWTAKIPFRAWWPAG